MQTETIKYLMNQSRTKEESWPTEINFIVLPSEGGTFVSLFLVV